MNALSLLSLGAASSGFLGGLMILSRSGRQWMSGLWISFLIWLVAAWLFQKFAYLSGLVHDYPHLHAATIWLNFLIAPMLFFYTRETLRGDQRPARKDWPHFLLAPLCFIALVPVYIQDSATKSAFIETYLSFSTSRHSLATAPMEDNLFSYYSIHFLIRILLCLQILLYSGQSLRLLYRHWRVAAGTPISVFISVWLAIGMLGFAILTLLSTIALNGTLLFSYLSWQAGSAIYLSSVVMIVAIASSRLNFALLPVAPEGPSPSVKDVSLAPPAAAPMETKYERSGLSTENSGCLWSEIKEFVERDKPYLDPSLTLSSLAGSMRMPPNYLSQAINENSGGNFHDFINRYRIDAAVGMLQEDEVRNRLSTLYLEVGFNSKSTFYVQFKKFMHGSTPSEYLNGMDARRRSAQPHMDQSALNGGVYRYAPSTQPAGV